MEKAIEEIEYLTRSSHRVVVLEELAKGPRERRELRGSTGASSPTLSRTFTEFEDRKLIDRDGPVYGLTRLGEFVLDRFLDLKESMETAAMLRDVWEWLPQEMEGFSAELFADAVVSYPGPRYPYEPVERLSHLIEGTGRLRGFDSIVYKSINNEMMCQAVLDGTELEFVFSPNALEGTFAWNPERVVEAASMENCTVLVHDDLPDGNRCGLGIVDDRACICCHDLETGALTAIIDTDTPAAREWAISTFERVRAGAQPVDPGAFDADVESDLTT